MKNKGYVIIGLGTLAAASLLFCGLAFAQPDGPPPGDGNGPPTPPQEAFDACQGKAAQDRCTAPGGKTMEGTCREIKEGLVCFPKDMPSRGNGPKPPSE